MRASYFAAIVVAAAFPAFGCAGAQPHVRSDAALGKVIIYRNGVAYFERSAHVEGDKLTLSVPAERIDDFLKSLTVVDAATGTALPVSFPAANKRHGDSVDLNIKLPRAGVQDLRLSYVTESPAWKPSYRVILADGGKARLHAWAVVDNVSGEDWNKVTVGVGSTSALSFKYDLHSVRLVERETLSNDTELAMAPPTGGSPYAVGGKEVKIVGNFKADQIDNIARMQNAQPQQQYGGNFVLADRSAANSPTTTTKSGRHSVQVAPKDKAGGSPILGNTSAGLKGAAEPASNLTLVPGTEALRAGNSRVRVEGFAQKGDADPRQSSLNRANVIREQLIAQGVSPDRVEAVGTGKIAQDGVRIVLADDEAKPSQASAKSLGARESEPMGSALFLSGTPMSLEDGRSAMVSLVQAEAEAKQVYYFDPVSSRGSNRFAFKAVRLVNPTQYTLEAGPFTVYAEGQFLGEGLSEPIPPRSVAFIPFGLDRELVVDPTEATREEINKLLTIQRGIISTETQRIRQTKLALNNRGAAQAEVFVRHAVAEGWTLKAGAQQKFEKLSGAYLFPVTVPARSSIDLVIEETMPIAKTVDIRTDVGVSAIELFLRTARLDEGLKGKLDDIVRLHKENANLQQKIETIESQMQVYRVRVDELHVQLVTLRQVPNAQALSRNLAQKMEEISNRLQKTTIEVTDLKGKLMTGQIAIQDRLAELTLAPTKDKDAKAAEPAPVAK
ncbi:MAG: hypothetical protein HY898_35905 [Deltaproteobacteria bacterium]|nr:hypothetical protein [Deltaproteobacteria bacterium]